MSLPFSAIELRYCLQLVGDHGTIVVRESRPYSCGGSTVDTDIALQVFAYLVFQARLSSTPVFFLTAII